MQIDFNYTVVAISCCTCRYIFPAMGLAARVTGALKITNDDFYQAALTLSELVLFICNLCIIFSHYDNNIILFINYDLHVGIH